MKQFLSLLLVVVVAVVITLLAHDNPAKVSVFLTEHRIDFSLNFAIVVLLLAVIALYFGISTVRASGQLPGRIKHFLQTRKQNALMKANTEAMIALITGDEVAADKALKNASKTGLATDLSYLIRAMSALQADELALAERIISHEQVSGGQHGEAVALLKAKISLAQGFYLQAVEQLDRLPVEAQRLKQAKRVRLLGLVGQGEWRAALEQYRILVGRDSRREADLEEALGKIYSGLCNQIQGRAMELEKLLSEARPIELQNPMVLHALADSLMACGLNSAARKMLESALQEQFLSELISIYHVAAVRESREALPFVEMLLEKHQDDVRLLELAAEVCEHEQLWGKAIARFEKVYKLLPSIEVAGKLEHLYRLANQPDKAKLWQGKLNEHLGIGRQFA